MSHTTIQDAQAESELSVFEALTPLARHWRTLFGIPLGLAIITAVVSLLMPKQYTAITTFTVESGTSTGGLNLGALSGLAGGLEVSSLLGAASPANFYAELATSRELLESTLNSRFRDYTAVSADSQATLLALLGVTGRTSQIRLAKGVRTLQKLMVATVSKKTQIVTVSVELGPAQLAADVANRLLELLNQFNLERRQLQSRERRRFAEERRAQAETELRAAEGRELSFLQSNRTYTSSPVLIFQHARLERDVSVRQEVYLTLAREYEQARIAEVRDTPLITIIDHAVIPDRKSSPKRSLMVILALMIGGLAAVFRIFGKELAQRSSTNDRRDISEFRGAVAQAKRELSSLLRLKRPERAPSAMQ